MITLLFYVFPFEFFCCVVFGVHMLYTYTTRAFQSQSFQDSKRIHFSTRMRTQPKRKNLLILFVHRSFNHKNRTHTNLHFPQPSICHEQFLDKCCASSRSSASTSCYHVCWYQDWCHGGCPLRRPVSLSILFRWSVAIWIAASQHQEQNTSPPKVSSLPDLAVLRK